MLLAAGLLAAGSPAVAQTGMSELEGVYRLDQAASADVPAAIDEATRDAGFFVRRVGRGVLKGLLKPASQLEIRPDSGGVAIIEGGARQWTVPGGPAVQVRNTRGERESLATEWDGQVLVRTFRGDKATRVTRYRPGPDGRTVEVAVEVTGKVLPKPLRYTLVYERLEAGGSGPDSVFATPHADGY